MTIDVKMAFRNIFRNTRRSLLTVSAVGVSCALLIVMLSFQLSGYDKILDVALRVETGHFQIQVRDYLRDGDIRQRFDPTPVLRKLTDLPYIKGLSPRARAFSLISLADRTYGVLVKGIVPEMEKEVSGLADFISEGKYLSREDETGAVIGTMLAENLHAKIGDELTVIGQGMDGSVAAGIVTIRGIYDSGVEEFDRMTVHIPLSLFNDLYFMDGGVHTVAGMLTSPDYLADVEKIVAEGMQYGGEGRDPLVLMDWRVLMPGLSEGIAIDFTVGIIMYLILVFVTAFGISNTYLMAVLERTREFGVMSAMGATPARLIRLLLMESAGMTVMGIFFGLLVGISVTLYFQAHGVDLGGSSETLTRFGISGKMYPRLSAASLTIGPISTALMTFFSSLYPVMKVRKLDAAEAMAYV